MNFESTASTAINETIYIIPVVNKKLCKRCGLCVQFCPLCVFTQDEEGYPVVRDWGKCTGCQLCFYYCPDFAIEVKVNEEE